MAVTPSDTAAVRAGRFRFRTPPLVLARMRLYPDRLELTGWHLRGRYRRTIMLGQLLQADALGDEQLLLWLADGETVRLHVEGAPRWKRTIEQQQRRLRNRGTGFNT